MQNKTQGECSMRNDANDDDDDTKSFMASLYYASICRNAKGKLTALLNYLNIMEMNEKIVKMKKNSLKGKWKSRARELAAMQQKNTKTIQNKHR